MSKTMQVAAAKEFYQDVLDEVKSRDEDNFSLVIEAASKQVEGLKNLNLADLTVDNFQKKWDEILDAHLKGTKQKEEELVEDGEGAETEEGDITVTSQVSVVGNALRGNTKALKLLKAMAPIAQEWSGKDWSVAVAAIVAASSQLESGENMGTYKEITDEEAMAWKWRHDKKVFTVGPYVLMKLLTRSGVAWEYYDDKTAGSWMRWTRNGIKVASGDRRSIQIDNEARLSLEEEEADWSTFLKGFEVDGHKVVFKDVDELAYRAADLFHCMYKVTKTPGKDRVTVTPHSKNLLQDVGGLYAFLGEVRDKIEVAVFNHPDTDMIMDKVAMVVEKMGVPKKIEAYINTQYKLLNSRVRGVKVQAMCMAKDTAEGYAARREAAWAEMGYDTNPSVAHKILKDSRAVRNVTPFSQYINKNAGSVHAANLPQNMETALKGRNMLEFLKSNKVDLTKEKGEVSVYGVAYGHMDIAFKEVPNVKYYDKARPGKSVANMIAGDIFGANGKIIIDDTLINDAPSKYDNMITKEFTKEHAKVAHLIAQETTQLAIIKLSLDNFDTPERRRRLSTMVNGAKSWTAAHVVKFGKLHNGEFFLVLSKLWKRVPNVDQDFKGVALMMNVANSLITDAQRVGVRFKVALPDIKEEGGKTWPIHKDNMRALWQLVIRANVSVWPWYMVSIPEDDPLRGGIMRNVMVLDGEFNYEEAALTYDEREMEEVTKGDAEILELATKARGPPKGKKSEVVREVKRDKDVPKEKQPKNPYNKATEAYHGKK